MRMEFELLLRRAFQCGRMGDPFGLANTDMYDAGLRQPDLHYIRFGISSALKKVSHDNDDGDKVDLVDRLKNLDKKTWDSKSTIQDLNKIIAEANEIFFRELNLMPQ